jgi:hypothetical protein
MATHAAKKLASVVFAKTPTGDAVTFDGGPGLA